MATTIDHTTLVEHFKNPSSFPHPVDHVEYIQTHISSVFLTGDFVYKLKKPVNFGFLNFTSPELRKQFCEAEVELNRRLAPEVYLRVAPITFDAGVPVIDGSGETIDWLVVMRQLDQQRLGLQVLAKGELKEDQIDAVVEELLPFYRQAATGEGVDEYGTPRGFKVNTDENFVQTHDWIGKALSQTRYDEIRQFTNDFFQDNEELLNRRVAEGRIRECHGDLHLGNIFFVDQTVIFDCIEFNQRFRCSDVAADLGFLAMDLDFRGRPELAQRLVNRYVELSDDQDLPKVIDFYRCYRAYVRGKIACFTAADPSLDENRQNEQIDLARRYFALAHRYADNTRRPVLAVVHGLMGTGKTSLTGYLRKSLGWSSLNTDTIRKQLAGGNESARVYVPYDQGIYSPEMNRRTFDEMYHQAAERLQAGQSVVLDGSFRRRVERARVRKVAEETGADPIFIQTTCEEAEQYRRLARREASNPNGSDGRVELIEAQKQDFEEPHPDRIHFFFTISTDGPKEETRAMMRAELERRGIE
ncbi:MAG: AAA family ATPase [Thermoanaerobaculales bacterium]|nr:AAA family ATPase [Thermoanaerobaculales bacterium]